MIAAGAAPVRSFGDKPGQGSAQAAMLKYLDGMRVLGISAVSDFRYGLAWDVQGVLADCP